MPFNITSTGGSGGGAPGPRGPQGIPGADALWNYVGEYNGGTSYAVGDIVTFDGQLWYRANANGGNVGDTPSEGFIWDLLAAKGEDGTGGSGGLVYLGNYVSGNGYVADLAIVRGSDNNLYIAKANGGLADPVGNTAEWDIFSNNAGGSANTADFVFTSEEGRSIISLPGDKGMRIDAGIDSDLYVTAGDDLYIQTLGQGDDIHLNAADDIRFTTNNEDSANEVIQEWRMDSEGRLQLPGYGYIQNPREETISSGTFTITAQDNYLNDQSGLNQATALSLPVNMDTLWFVGNNYLTSPVTITFADLTTTTTISIYDATSQGLPAVIFQWDDGQRNKTYEETFPVTISAVYDNISYGNSTLVLDPNDNGNDQQLIIDATAPNHIHVRAGGPMDYSNAELILGGERAGVHVSDQAGDVWVQTKKEDYNWSWQNVNPAGGTTYIVGSSMAEPDIGDFTIQNGIKYVINSVVRNEQEEQTSYTAIGSNGVLLGFIPYSYYTFTRDNGNYTWRFEAIDDAPALVLPPEEPVIVNMAVPGDITLSAYNGIKIGASSGFGIEFPDQTIQTTAYIPGAGVNGEITRWTPNFTATGLAFTGSGATHPTYNSHYVKNGRMVSFFIEIDMATVTNFGTGQYKTELPFAPLAGTMNHFQSWCLVDENANPDNTGHAILQADHLANTSVLDLHYIKQSGGANSPVMEALFKQGSPVTLTTATHVYINGTYITAD